MRLLVSAGLRPAPGAPARAHLVELDLDGDRVRAVPIALDPAGLPGPDAPQELTCACLDADGLVVQPAHGELLWIAPDTLRVVRRVTHPLFHNLHSAAVHPDGRIAVTCAGTESVLELSPDGAVLRHHFLRGGDFAAAYPGVTDFRRAPHDAFKPHSHHPNHACWVGEDLWVTRFETQDCASLTRPRVIPLPGGIPHDGRERDGRLWFTRITGHVVAVDPATLTPDPPLDLSEGSRRPLGWCRGIEVVGERLFVGFSALRPTRHREVLRQLVWGRDAEHRPARVVEVDRRTGALRREWALPGPGGATIYGILAVSG